MSLPKDFIWGFGTASYQIEGAVAEDGRLPSIWDTFARTPGKIADGSTGDVACDSYHRTAEDIALLKDYGAKAYRFSLSWPRIIPLGGRDDPINQKGLDHYVKFVKDLNAAGVKPVVTLYQWDLPQTLFDRYGGPLNQKEFVADFTNFARIVFAALGPYVQTWMTFTEPLMISTLGYNTGLHAPGRTSDRTKSPEGDSSREVWIVGHSLLVAHGSAVKVYRDDFKPTQGGEIGITLWACWPFPYDESEKADHDACVRFREFNIQWFADPIYFGDYPESMKEQLGDRLPSWSDEDIALVKGSNDFYGLDYYTSTFVQHKTTPADLNDTIGNVIDTQWNSKGEPIGPETGGAWLRPCPEGLRRVLNFLHKRYQMKIYVAENGTSIKDEDNIPMEEALKDTFRCNVYKEHVEQVVKAYNEDDVDVRMYLAWSLLDNFEWQDGYPVRFGVTYVDFKDNAKRYPKKSSKVLGELFKSLIKA